MWLPQLEAVPDAYRYVAHDERGFGSTEVGDTQFSSYRDVLTVMDSLGIATTVLVGCSMGAGVALDVAIVAPQRVSGMVLVGAASPGLEVDPSEPPEWPEAVKAFKAGASPIVPPWSSRTPRIWSVSSIPTPSMVPLGVSQNN